jgi:hypothetical protein
VPSAHQMRAVLFEEKDVLARKIVATVDALGNVAIGVELPQNALSHQIRLFSLVPSIAS